MNPETRAWQAFVLAAGIGVAVTAGALSLRTYSASDAATWTALLLWTFGLSYGANRLQFWMARPPLVFWKAALLGVVTFLPLFLGMFPASNWLQATAREHGYRGTSSPFWIFALIVWGLFAPVGLIGQRIRELRARPR